MVTRSPLLSKNAPFLFWEGPGGLGAIEPAVTALEVTWGEGPALSARSPPGSRGEVGRGTREPGREAVLLISRPELRLLCSGSSPGRSQWLSGGQGTTT